MLEQLDGDEESYNEILRIFLEDASVQMEKLKRSIEENDLLLVRQHAHTIKGASANIGANALKEAAFQMELAGKENDPDRARSLLELVEQSFESLKDILMSMEDTNKGIQATNPP